MDKIINKYLLEVDFPYNDNILPYKKDMIDQFKKNVKKNYRLGGSNVLYKNEGVRKNLETIFLDIIKKCFIVSPNLNRIEPFIYISTKEEYRSVWHNHVDSATISATFYLETNDKGGGLEFAFNNPQDPIIYPKKNKLYLFPSWMYHRPLPPEDDKIRICVNMEYFSFQRPQVLIHSGNENTTPIFW